MGAKPSRTRKLTIENEGPTSVIKISDGLAQRLKGNQQSKEEVSLHDQMNAASSWSSVRDGIPIGASLPFLHEPTLTSLQLRQEKLEELKKNDEYWEKRIKELQASHKKMHEVMEHEYHKALIEIKGEKKENSDTQVQVTPCVTNSQAVMECYKMYPNEPMRCAKEVQAFAECVDMKRATIVASRG